jgi:predicted DNA-binding transcriptional regulator AlpA
MKRRETAQSAPVEARAYDRHVGTSFLGSGRPRGVGAPPGLHLLLTLARLSGKGSLRQEFEVESHCMTNHLVGVTEISRLLGVSRQRADQITREYTDFPEPEVELVSGRVWRRSAVEEWLQNHPHRRPGRPTRSSQ